MSRNIRMWYTPRASGEVRGGPGQRSGEGSQIPPNDLLFNTEPGHAKFPAVVGFLDREVTKRLAENKNPDHEDSTAWKRTLRTRRIQGMALNECRRCRLQAVDLRLRSRFPTLLDSEPDPIRRDRESCPRRPC